MRVFLFVVRVGLNFLFLNVFGPSIYDVYTPNFLTTGDKGNGIRSERHDKAIRVPTRLQ